MQLRAEHLKRTITTRAQVACAMRPPKSAVVPFESKFGFRFERQLSGERTFDLNTDGIAHYGLLADWLEDVRQHGQPSTYEAIQHLRGYYAVGGGILADVGTGLAATTVSARVVNLLSSRVLLAGMLVGVAHQRRGC